MVYIPSFPNKLKFVAPIHADLGWNGRPHLIILLAACAFRVSPYLSDIIMLLMLQMLLTSLFQTPLGTLEFKGLIFVHGWLETRQAVHVEIPNKINDLIMNYII